jgi:2-keto-3-deoxy-L-fuconate dehydrogenase
MESLTYAMAADFAEFAIRVNAVAPGTADTPWVGRLLDAAADPHAERSALEARQPSGRLVRADEVALAIAYLATHPAESVNFGSSRYSEHHANSCTIVLANAVRNIQ